jgi:hypothetical protein
MLSELELANLFIEYAEHGKKQEEIAKKIEAEILERKESSKIAGVNAKYFKEGFETPDYEQAAKSYLSSHPDFDLSPYSTPQEPSVKWKEVCEVLQIEAPKGAPKPARVTIK